MKDKKRDVARCFKFKFNKAFKLVQNHDKAYPEDCLFPRTLDENNGYVKPTDVMYYFCLFFYTHYYFIDELFLFLS